MRKLLGWCLLPSILLASSFGSKPAPVAPAKTEAFAPLSPQDALQRLVKGNQNYMHDKPTHPDCHSCRREEIVEKQRPFAVILGCSDSRVSPEIIFDAGLGDLFIVRNAGSIVGAIGLDSIEYGIKQLGAVVVMVLGHQSCGAVTAVLEGNTVDLESIADLVRPAIRGAKDVETAIKANVHHVVAHLSKSSVLKKAMEEKKLIIQGAYYHLGSGEVELLKD
jgi:carbonic anhydrase